MSIIHEALSKAVREGSQEFEFGSSALPVARVKSRIVFARISWKLPLALFLLLGVGLAFYGKSALISSSVKSTSVVQPARTPSPVPLAPPKEESVSLEKEQAVSPMDEGLSSYRRGDLDAAEGAFLKAVRSSPEVPEGHNNLGIVLRARGRLEEAGAYYKEALRLNPNYAEALYNLGAVADRLGKTDEAIAHYRKALAAKPSLTEAHYQLAVALERTGDLDAAKTQYSAFLEKFQGQSQEAEQVRRHLLQLRGQ